MKIKFANTHQDEPRTIRLYPRSPGASISVEGETGNFVIAEDGSYIVTLLPPERVVIGCDGAPDAVWIKPDLIYRDTNGDQIKYAVYVNDVLTAFAGYGGDYEYVEEALAQVPGLEAGYGGEGVWISNMVPENNRIRLVPSLKPAPSVNTPEPSFYRITKYDVEILKTWNDDVAGEPPITLVPYGDIPTIEETGEFGLCLTPPTTFVCYGATVYTMLQYTPDHEYQIKINGVVQMNGDADTFIFEGTDPIALVQPDGNTFMIMNTHMEDFANPGQSLNDIVGITGPAENTVIFFLGNPEAGGITNIEVTKHIEITDVTQPGVIPESDEWYIAFYNMSKTQWMSDTGGTSEEFDEVNLGKTLGPAPTYKQPTYLYDEDTGITHFCTLYPPPPPSIK